MNLLAIIIIAIIAYLVINNDVTKINNNQIILIGLALIICYVIKQNYYSEEKFTYVSADFTPTNLYNGTKFSDDYSAISYFKNQIATHGYNNNTNLQIKGIVMATSSDTINSTNYGKYAGTTSLGTLNILTNVSQSQYAINIVDTPQIPSAFTTYIYNYSLYPTTVSYNNNKITPFQNTCQSYSVGSVVGSNNQPMGTGHVIKIVYTPPSSTSSGSVIVTDLGPVA